MTKKLTYSDKLKDPRWQKKRLDIMNRDNFCCQMCYTEEKTLHVHHRHYFDNLDPWEYQDEYLVTLCEDCHEGEGDALKVAMRELTNVAKTRFFAADIMELAAAFRNAKSGYCSLTLAESLHHFLSDPKNIEKMEDDYIAYRLQANKRNTIFGE